MTVQNAFLVNWLKGAYSLELGLAPMLEQQTSGLDDDTQLYKSLCLHLDKTRIHASLLRERLQGLGEDVSSILPVEPVTAMFARSNGRHPDAARRVELLDYVTEAFEVALYRALRTLAEMVGDPVTSRMCDRILADELAISDALHRRLPGDNGRLDIRAATQGKVMLADEVFAALNAHDLDRLERLLADDFRAELSNDTALLDKKQNRARLQAFFAAFPDLRYKVSRVSASGDSVFVEWSATATHDGPFLTRTGETLQPTGRQVELSGVTVLRFLNGRLVHMRVSSDSGNLMRQLQVASGAEKVSSAPAPVGRPGRGGRRRERDDPRGAGHAIRRKPGH